MNYYTLDHARAADVVSADYIKSFSSGPLKTFSFTPVLLPVTGDINDDFGRTGHVNVAAKAYFLLYDTDIDFMFLSGAASVVANP